MTDAVKIPPTVINGQRHPALRLLVTAAILSTIFGFLYFIGLMGKLIVDGSIHSTSSPAISAFAAAIGLIWDVTLVILFIAIRHQISGKNQIYADLGVVFMSLLAACSGINWYVQLTLIPKLALTGDTAALALLGISNVNSLMYAMEHLAWGLFYGLATIFMGLAFGSGKVESWIRWLLIIGGVMSILFIPGYMISNQLLIDLGYYAAGVLLPITTILLVIRFGKRREK